jgi:hypothetical protein
MVIYICRAGVKPRPLELRPLIGLFYSPCNMDGHHCEAISRMNEWKDKPKNLEKTCPSADLSITENT